MADLFVKQAEQYAAGRPSYPAQLFHFIASKTKSHDLAWDVGTGTGQAAQSLAGIYKKVIATDTSEKQLQHATKLPNVRYQHTPPTMSMAELEQKVASQGTIDLVTVAQALHWFDLPMFYQQVKWVLKKPHGVFAAWGHKLPRTSGAVDKVLDRLYAVDARPHWGPGVTVWENEYRGVDFPFEPVAGADQVGPFEFVGESVLDLEKYLMFVRSWSAYSTAKEKGVDLLRDDVVEEFRNAWSEDGCGQKVVKYPIFLRIGRVGDNRNHNINSAIVIVENRNKCKNI